MSRRRRRNAEQAVGDGQRSRARGAVRETRGGGYWFAFPFSFFLWGYKARV